MSGYISVAVFPNPRAPRRGYRRCFAGPRDDEDHGGPSAASARAASRGDLAESAIHGGNGEDPPPDEGERAEKSSLGAMGSNTLTNTYHTTYPIRAHISPCNARRCERDVRDGSVRPDTDPCTGAGPRAPPRTTQVAVGLPAPSSRPGALHFFRVRFSRAPAALHVTNRIAVPTVATAASRNPRHVVLWR